MFSLNAGYRWTSVDPHVYSVPEICQWGAQAWVYVSGWFMWLASLRLHQQGRAKVSHYRLQNRYSKNSHCVSFLFQKSHPISLILGLSCASSEQFNLVISTPPISVLFQKFLSYFSSFWDKTALFSGSFSL